MTNVRNFSVSVKCDEPSTAQSKWNRRPRCIYRRCISTSLESVRADVSGFCFALSAYSYSHPQQMCFRIRRLPIATDTAGDTSWQSENNVFTPTTRNTQHNQVRNRYVPMYLGFALRYRHIHIHIHNKCVSVFVACLSPRIRPGTRHGNQKTTFSHQRQEIHNTIKFGIGTCRCIWVLLCVIGIFIFTSTTNVFPYSSPAYRHGYGRGHVMAIRKQRFPTNDKKYTTQSDGRAVLTTGCSYSSRLCSDSAVRNCIVARDHFPEEQHWNNNNASFPGSRFVPRFCQFKYDVIPPQLLQRCLQQKQIKRIVVIGDSHGNRYFGALEEMLKPITRCTQLRKDLSENYFSRRRRRATKFPKQKSHKRYNVLFECIFVNSSDKTGNDNGDSLPRSVLI